MDARLSKASSMLRTFLEEELSETHLGLPAGGRAHMERFRSFLLSFYTTKLGYYPPPPADGRSSSFEPEVYRLMCDDFEALYQLLVNEGFTSAENTPFLAQGGICTVQSVHAFDLRCNYRSLDHPLPLLPEVTTTPTSRRIPWLSRGDKLKPDQRLVLHAAQVKASNHSNASLLRNDLVRAYRRFEEQSVAPLTKVDRSEKISLVDVRKVRWILVYAVYQVLRNCTDIPEEVNDIDTEYNLAVATECLPHWDEDTGALAYQSNSTSVVSSSSVSMHTPSSLATPTFASEFRIEPDIDYFAIHRDEQKKEDRHSVISRVKSTPPRAMGFGKSISRNSTVRRSMSIFKGFHGTGSSATPTPRKASYHEIVVHGYGNGTNSVNMNAMVKTPSPVQVSPICSTASRALSTSSKDSVDSEADSNGSSVDTAASSAPPTSPKNTVAVPVLTSNDAHHPPILSPIPIRDRRREVLSLMIPTIPIPPRSRPVSMAPGTNVSKYAFDYERLVEEDRERERAALSPAPLRIRKSLLGPFSASATHLPRDADAWQPYAGDGSAASANDVKPMWEQFNDLGGLMAPATVPMRA
ncbi:hypothetical protein ACHAQA_001577 [Verticillium albo-atrum]